MKKGSTKGLLRLATAGMLAFMFLMNQLASAGPAHLAKNEQSAADKSVSGKVLSAEDSSPVPGVTVVLKGTTTGTTTDVDGRYQINVPGNN